MKRQTYCNIYIKWYMAFMSCRPVIPSNMGLLKTDIDRNEPVFKSAPGLHFTVALNKAMVCMSIKSVIYLFRTATIYRLDDY